MFIYTNVIYFILNIKLYMYDVGCKMLKVVHIL